MWHFDEKLGLWLEEGTGTVVESETSPVGLAVQANVKHFSTWNWDFKFQNAGSVTVKCELADGNATECNVIADVTLDDGSHFTKSNTVPAAGLTVINMPSTGSIVWKGSTTGGLLGTATSGTTGAVVIKMKTPKTQNFVQRTINSVASACTATLESTLTYAIPASGATVVTSLDTTSLSWSARSDDLIENGKIVYYTGNAVSNATGAVILNLNTRVEKATAAHTILVGCINDNETKATSCNLTITRKYEEVIGTYLAVPIGSHVAITLPNETYADTPIGINAHQNEAGQQISGHTSFHYGDLTDGQLINVQLYLPR